MHKILAFSKYDNFPSFEICSIVKVTEPRTGLTICTKAIWDTGATMSMIKTSFAKQLGLEIIGYCTICSVTGSVDEPSYQTQLTLCTENGTDLMTFAPQVCGCDYISTSGDVGIIIGMDIITQGDFCVSNDKTNTVMSFRFPSSGIIDFNKNI